jgi:pyruvate,water dikinase
MTVLDGQAGWVRVARIVEIARKVHIPSRMCGQSSTTNIALAEHLVRQGVTSVSVNSDGTTAARHIGAVPERTLRVESALARTHGDSYRG